MYAITAAPQPPECLERAGHLGHQFAIIVENKFPREHGYWLFCESPTRERAIRVAASVTGARVYQMDGRGEYREVWKAPQ